jgi:hypothetical protein
MRLLQMTQKLQAVAALFALLVASVPALAESFGAVNMPAYCNIAFCPMHRGQSQQQRNDKSNCDGQSRQGENDCSMRACDTTSPLVVGTSPYVLATPLAIRYPASAEPARIQAVRFFTFIVSIPLTPPPRTLPS